MKKNKLYAGLALIMCCACTWSGCSDDEKNSDGTKDIYELKVKTLSQEMQEVRNYAPLDAVIGHRGTAYWAPESTEAAYRWAREAGVDYLEADLQLTKDSTIVIVHDDNILAKTDVSQKFPEREVLKDGKPYYYVRDFTLAELRQLDAGTWFNNDDHKDQWRSSFAGLKILTLQDMVMIAQGYQLKYGADGIASYESDPQWTGNLPGIYLETKQPQLNPGQNIEKKLYDELDRLGWNIVTKPAVSTEFYKDGKINVGNTNGKVVFQTFSKESLATLNTQFQSKVPLCLLLWFNPNDAGNSMVADTPQEFVDWINYGVENGAQFVGPSIAEVITEGSGTSSTYADLLSGWRADLFKKSGMYAHPYTFDKVGTMDKYYQLCQGMFTNIAVESINFYKDKGKRLGAPAPDTPEAILDRLGYFK